MKKLFIIFMAVILVAALSITGVLAANSYAIEKTQKASYADKNEDGICDNKNENSGVGYVDADEDGVCDNKNENCGVGYVDADEDGICDNKNEICGGTGKGTGCGKGFGRCRNFE